MGLFDPVVGALAGGEAGSQGGLLQAVMQLVNDPKMCGLEGLIHTCQQGGLGALVNS